MKYVESNIRTYERNLCMYVAISICCWTENFWTDYFWTDYFWTD